MVVRNDEDGIGKLKEILSMKKLKKKDKEKKLVIDDLMNVTDGKVPKSFRHYGVEDKKHTRFKILDPFRSMELALRSVESNV